MFISNHSKVDRYPYLGVSMVVLGVLISIAGPAITIGWFGFVCLVQGGPMEWHMLLPLSFHAVSFVGTIVLLAVETRVTVLVRPS